MNDIVQAFKEYLNKLPQPYDCVGEVVRIEGDIAWVQIPGSDEEIAETPVRLTISAKEGDTVQVRVSGGTAFLVGNATAPPTDDTEAYVAQAKAEEVQADLNEQKEYFWHDDEGAHIQGNLSGYRNDLKSDGMHIIETDSSEELAVFGAGGVQIGKNTGAHIVMSPGQTVFYNDMNDCVGQIKTSDVAPLKISYTSNDVVDMRTHTDATIIVKISVANIDLSYGDLRFGISYSTSAGGTHTTWSMTFDAEGSDTSPDDKITATFSDGEIIVTYNEARTYLEFDYTYSYYVLTAIPRYQFGTVNKELGDFSFVAGKNLSASNKSASAFGEDCEANGDYSHAVGQGSIANGTGQIVLGQYNVKDTAPKEVYPVPGRREYLLILGNGESANDRSNALTVDWQGNVDTPSGRLTAQKTTTTWTVPTASGATKTAGGYYAEGKHVYVSISCTLNFAASAGDNVTLFTGLTAPLFMVPLEVMVANQRNGVAWINDSGELHFRPSASVSTSNAVIINGHYTSA